MKIANPSDEHILIARYLGLNPNDPANWPHATINRLAQEKKAAGDREFFQTMFFMCLPPTALKP